MEPWRNIWLFYFSVNRDSPCSYLYSRSRMQPMAIIWIADCPVKYFQMDRITIIDIDPLHCQISRIDWPINFFPNWVEWKVWIYSKPVNYFPCTFVTHYCLLFAMAGQHIYNNLLGWENGIPSFCNGCPTYSIGIKKIYLSYLSIYYHCMEYLEG